MTVTAGGVAIFDIDGTLTDTVIMHHGVLGRVIQSFAVPRLDTNWITYPNHTDTAIFADAWLRGFGAPPSPEASVEFEARMIAEFGEAAAQAPVREIPGAARFVHALRERGWRVAFATGNVRAIAESKLNAIGVPFAAAEVATSSEHPVRTELVAGALRRVASTARSQTVVSIGDGLWDLEAANSLGIRFLGIGVGPTADTFMANGKEVVEGYQDLSEALSRFESCVR